MPWRSAVLLSLTLAAPLACDGMGPEELAQGRFELERAAGQPLPAHVSNAVWLVSGELEIQGTRFNKVTMARLEWGGPTRLEEVRSRGSVEFRSLYGSFHLVDEAGEIQAFDIVDRNTLSALSPEGTSVIYKRAR